MFVFGKLVVLVVAATACRNLVAAVAIYNGFGCGRSCLFFLRQSLLRVLVVIATLWQSCVATASQFC
ncbi:MAG: hypothetical protein M3P18_11150 [Actinomycetota bacterium]|nr:hypothetical protein [Actinomycetota bacterium]